MVKTCLKLLICPFCKSNIPFLTLVLGNGQYNIISKCDCSPDETQAGLKEFVDYIKRPYLLDGQCANHDAFGEQFCLNTATWLCKDCLKDDKGNPKELDLVINKVYVTCQKHLKAFSCYCEQCKVNLCPQCKDEHDTSHALIQLTEIDSALINNSYTQLNAILNKNKEIHEKIMEELRNELAKETPNNEDISILRNELMASWKNNSTINNLLREFYKCFNLTAASIKKYPCYQIQKLFDSIQINNSEINLNKLSLRDRVLIWKDYLDYNWIVMQKDKKKVIKVEFKEKAIKKPKQPQQHAKRNNDNSQFNKFNCFGILSEHQYPIRCLAMLNDNRIASGSDDKTIKIWNTTTKTCEKTLLGHINSVWCLVQLTDGTLVSGSFDKSIKFWNIDTWICKATLLGHSYSVRCLVQINDKTLASGSVDKTIKLWSVITLQCKYTFNGHTSFVWSLAKLNQDYLASGSEDTTIRIWNTTTMDYKDSLKGHTFAIKSLVLLNKNILISGSADCSIKVWDIVKLNCLATLSGHELSVECLIKINEKTIISGSDDKTMKIWNVNAMNCCYSCIGHDSYIWCLLKLDERQFASGSWDNTIKLWTLSNQNQEE